ncbi:MAG TPA: ferredoxin [Aliidongia sp.]|uniref:ferredoxin n=1 Tax=Aliidongia sp. TaxID=1914230 RepID=UPI002DDCF58D|nr:ferredoxin [Aliidongia sp.]HEV2673778.1 ferredoxin [Aliidongia sp.]
MGKIKIHIDQVKCVGAGQCVMASPQVFDQREEDGIVFLLMDEAPADLVASVRKAAKLCPAVAITLEEQ